MGRVSTVKKLLPEQRTILNAVIRRQSYCSLDAMVAELSALGIDLSRSALHRYSIQLEASDAAHAGSPNDTVVVIVERRTGGTTTLTTTASREAVLSAIEALSIPA